jgi:iron complex transport system substrate-binding protein
VVAFDPQVLVVAPCGFDLSRTLIEARVLPSWAGFDALSATRSGRVWAVDGNAYFNRSGPRLVDSAEILAHLFHPQHFAPPACVDASAPPWQRLT